MNKLSPFILSAILIVIISGLLIGNVFMSQHRTGENILPTKQPSISQQQTITPRYTPTIIPSQQVSTVPEKLGSCSYPTNMCPAGYECYTSVNGGLGPNGKVDKKVVAGDQKCHKVCTSNTDCKRSEQCVTKQLQREDVTLTTKICL